MLPDIPGIEHAIASDDVFFLERLPERIVVVGGGYIAVELAGVFAGLGVEVTQLYRGPLFLRGFDDDIRLALADEMRKRGVDLRFEANVAAIERTANGGGGRGGIRAVLAGMGAAAEGGSGDPEVLEADLILYATGRRPNNRGARARERRSVDRPRTERCSSMPGRGPTSNTSGPSAT